MTSEPKQMDLVDFITRGIRAREAVNDALKKVAKPNEGWKRLAMAIIAKLPIDTCYTGEQINEIVRKRIGAPTHPGAYGMLIREAQRHNMIRKTGRYLPMTKKGSHSRITPEYRTVTQ